MEKWIQFIVAEIIEATIFIMLILIVSFMQETFPNYPVTVGLLVTIWAIMGIATPFVIFDNLREDIENMFNSFR